MGSGGESYLTHVIGKTINEFVAEQQGNNIESNTCSIKKVEGLLLVLNKCQQSGMQDDELIGILHNASHGKNHLGALVPNAVAIITQIIIDHYAPTQEGEHLDAFKVNIQGYGIGLNGDSKILVPDQTKIVEYNLWHDAGYVVHAEAHEVGVAGGEQQPLSS